MVGLFAIQSSFHFSQSGTHFSLGSNTGRFLLMQPRRQLGQQTSGLGLTHQSRLGHTTRQLPVADQGVSGQAVEFNAALGQSRAGAVDQRQHAQQQWICRQSAYARVVLNSLGDAINLGLSFGGLGLWREVGCLEPLHGLAPLFQEAPDLVGVHVTHAIMRHVAGERRAAVASHARSHHETIATSLMATDEGINLRGDFGPLVGFDDLVQPVEQHQAVSLRQLFLDKLSQRLIAVILPANAGWQEIQQGAAIAIFGVAGDAQIEWQAGGVKALDLNITFAQSQRMA